MKNAYTILGVAQNANTIDIVKGQVNAMKCGKFSSTEIAIAKKAAVIIFVFMISNF